MNSTLRIIMWLIGLILVVIIGIEVVYRVDKCCDCSDTVKTVCDTNRDKAICKGEIRSKDGCCKCSFIKEQFGIDLYSWRYNK